MPVSTSCAGARKLTFHIAQAVPGISYWPDADVYNVSGGCRAVAGLPDVTFTLDGIDYSLGPETYIIQVPCSACPALVLCSLALLRMFGGPPTACSSLQAS